VLADELGMKFPGPEFLFTAPSEAEWAQGRDQMLTPVSSCTVSLTLAALLCDTTDTVQLPYTLMGRFVLLHGKHAGSTRTSQHPSNRDDIKSLPH
jgi:hypothetical protein